MAKAETPEGRTSSPASGTGGRPSSGARTRPRRNLAAYLAGAIAALAAGLLVVTTLNSSGLFRQAVPSQAVGSQFAPAAVTTPLAAQPPAAAAAPGPDKAAAPNFTARLIDGGTFILSEQQGKPVLLLFAASWCVSCIPEVNKMAQLQEEFGKRGLQQVVLSVDPGDTPADFAVFRQRTRGQNLLWGLDTGQQAARAYRIQALETKVFIDPTGREVFRAVGVTAIETLRQRISAVVG